ncbi:hypothetical protein CU097_001199, partial [Rhizopus azygosporus]
DWEDNERGVSYVFGKKVINEFLSKFDLDLVCRAHMVVEDGYEFFANRSLVTVFSAPNYCGEFDNFGAIMSVYKIVYKMRDKSRPYKYSTSKLYKDAGRGQTIQCEDPIGMRDEGRPFPMLMIRS